MDKFESIRAFTKVVEAGGFAAAAREMNVSRSAVNKLVINLEDDLGVQLLHRTTRQVTPTETGLGFYDRCMAILADLAEAELSVSQIHDEPKGNLRINAPMSFGTLHLAPAIAEFAAQYPDLRIQLTLEDRLVDPIEEGFDLTVRISYPPEAAGLIVHVIAPVPLLLCASPDYLAAHGLPQQPSDLRDHSCLHYGYLSTSNQWKLRDVDGNEHTVTISGVLCSNYGEVLRDAALQGLGIAMLPAFLMEQQLVAGQLQIVLSNYRSAELSICIIYPANRHLSTKVRLLTDFLKARFCDRSQP